VTQPTNPEFHVAALTVAGEARGEPKLGKLAVANVIRNRVIRPHWWGTSISSVCLKESNGIHQFSCWNRGDPNSELLANLSTESDIYQSAMDAVIDAFVTLIPDPSNGADHYHVDHMLPWWAKGKQPVSHIGRHIFYQLER
jgi:N-acetylmuramoyl-L-alanine amidase